MGRTQTCGCSASFCSGLLVWSLPHKDMSKWGTDKINMGTFSSLLNEQIFLVPSFIYSLISTLPLCCQIKALRTNGETSVARDCKTFSWTSLQEKSVSLNSGKSTMSKSAVFLCVDGRNIQKQYSRQMLCLCGGAEISVNQDYHVSAGFYMSHQHRL